MPTKGDRELNERTILAFLVNGEETIERIREHLGVSARYASTIVRGLAEQGLIEKRTEKLVAYWRRTERA